MTHRTYVDIHVLQTVPPSNLNRDDAGSPKQAVYGGTRRARVSSQAWKRAARRAFHDQVPAERLGSRTKKIVAMLAAGIAARTDLDPASTVRLATATLTAHDISMGKKAGETAYLLFFGRQQVERLADLVSESATDLVALDDAELGKALASVPVRQTLGTGHPIDVALFGRMVADIPSLNVDAATQVAHALSTHAVEVEFDYYTAVDDENPKEETGAGMIGTVEFNSATLYRFATVGLHQLVANLDDDVDAATQALEVFLRSFVCSMPTGKENTFAHRTLPTLVSVVVREDQPVNLVSAFESAVRPDREVGGIAAASVRKLVETMQTTSDLWGMAPVHIASSYTSTDADAAAVLGVSMPFSDVVSSTVSSARERLSRSVDEPVGV